MQEDRPVIFTSEGSHTAVQTLRTFVEEHLPSIRFYPQEDKGINHRKFCHNFLPVPRQARRSEDCHHDLQFVSATVRSRRHTHERHGRWMI